METKSNQFSHHQEGDSRPEFMGRDLKNMNTIDKIHRTRDLIQLIGNVIFGFAFIAGLMALVVFFDELLRPLK